MFKYDIRIYPQEAVSRSESLEHAGRRLLGERSSLRQSLAASQQLLSGLTAAFDPLSQGGQAARQEDVLQAAERLHGTAAALSNRLVGATKKVTPCSCSCSCTCCRTISPKWRACTAARRTQGPRGS